MPGSPPSSTSEPGTTPPPSTRSNSSMPVDRRTPVAVSTSAYSFAAPVLENCAYRLFPFGAAATDSVARSSTSEFQAPHSAQRPSHFGDCAPHSWQTNTTFGGFMRTDRIQPSPGLHPDSCFLLYLYCLSTLVPRRQTISHGIVPIAAATSRASMRCQLSSPCRPRSTTSSPGWTSP